ncbi:MAG: VCBS repeat-containing protein, partial [Deltaproteobacteria bacterium]|nr:VCBS repeat-containing protein [Deltaproteobacteria bacterium]
MMRIRNCAALLLISLAVSAQAAAAPFGAQQVISTTADDAYSVFVADLDGDGDLDVLSASQADDKIAWYENTDGVGSFGSGQIISTAADGAHAVFAADVDGDGDLDALSASEADDKIAWYENTDGAGSFGSQQVISTAAGGA